MRKIKDRFTDFFKNGHHYIDVSERLKQSTLFEVYHKTGKYDCQFFFGLLWTKLTNQITKKDFDKELLKRNLAFEEIEKDEPIVSGRFEPETKLTFIKVSTGLEKLIKENIKSKFDAVAYSQLEKLSDFYWHNFVHEDTHKQQAQITLLEFFNNYVTYDSSIFQDLKNGKVDDDFVKDTWNTYKDPRISEKAQRSFIRALYDY